MNRRSLFAVLAFPVATTLAAPLSAQTTATRVADSLLAHGMLDRAEAIYYAEARKRPRDPQARAALGLFLGARGAAKIGVTLLEEALRFGGDRQELSAALANGYSYLNDWRSTALLPASPLTAAQRERNSWLIQHPTRVIAGDSALLLAFAHSPVDGFIGVTPIRLNGVTVKALIQPRTQCKIALSDTSRAAAKLRRFRDKGERMSDYLAAAADSVGFGRMTILGVPIEVQRLAPGIEAIVCLGELMPFAPTFDPRAGLITLRLGGIVAPAPASAPAFPFYAADGELTVIRAGGITPILAPAVRSLFTENRWTLDTRRGQVVLDAARQ